MYPWFSFNGQNSQQMGVFVSRLPMLARAEERVQRVTIPGRAGHLTIKEGQDVYNGFSDECVITAPADADFPRILRWLSGSGRAIFSHDPDYAYQVDIAGIVRFDRVSNSLHQATIPFYFQPFKGRAIPDPPIIVTAQSASVFNPGNVLSLPVVAVDYTGSIEITIGGYTMVFTALSAPIIVDCGAEIITDENGDLWQGKYSGDFWRIPAGTSAVAVSESGCTLSIDPKWRLV